MNRKMFCFDLDNTLLNHRTYQVSERAIKAIATLKEAGHVIVLASGRDFETPNSQPFELLIKPDATVHSNGLKVTMGDTPLFAHYFDKSLMMKVIEAARQLGLCVGASIQGGEFYTHYEVLRDFEIRMSGHCEKTFQDADRLLDYKVHALHFMGTEQDIKRLCEEISGLHYYMFNGNFGADLLDIGWSKAEGIEKLLKHYNMDWSDVISFGDSMNDREMIRRSAKGYAVGNSVSALKEVADEVIGTIEEDGVALLLEERYI